MLFLFLEMCIPCVSDDDLALNHTLQYDATGSFTETGEDEPSKAGQVAAGGADEVGTFVTYVSFAGLP